MRALRNLLKHRLIPKKKLDMLIKILENQKGTLMNKLGVFPLLFLILLTLKLTNLTDWPWWLYAHPLLR